MDRREFLKKLKTLWQENAEMGEALTITDLLDDAATLGMEGASEAYVTALLKPEFSPGT